MYAIQNWLPGKLSAAVKTARSGVFTIDMLENHFKNLTEFDNKEDGKDFVLFFEPPSLDLRIVNQVALFSFMSNPVADLGEWLVEISEQTTKPIPEAERPIYRKIIISANAKWEIRDKLDQTNINERVLFPGPDGLSSWLKRWYSPKQATKLPDPGKESIPASERKGIS
jgi:hypothetical protein